MLKRFLGFGFCLFIYLNHTISQATKFERTNGKETATYFEIINWYKELDNKSTRMVMKTMGPTDAGYPLHLVLVSADKQFDPVKWKADNKIIIMINNGIHPGEPDGIDASMMLVRDIINDKIQLPSNVVLGLIPVYNIGGCLNRNSYSRVNQNGPDEYGFRGNSQNLDLNRDFTKCDSREARSFTEIFHFLKPHLLIDNHVSDGADYQHTMTLISTQYDKLGKPLGEWLRNDFEPQLYLSMNQKGLQMIPYVDFATTDFNKGMQMFYDPPRYSSGYASLFNTISFMPETHMLKPYKERVYATYELMKTFIKVSSSNSTQLTSLRKQADSAMLQNKTFPLKWIPDNNGGREIEFRGYERDTTLSSATGLKKMYYNHSKPFVKNIIFYDNYKPANEIETPFAYLIPQGWHEVIDLLKLNGVRMQELARDTFLEVSSYKIEDYKSLANPYEKHHKNHSVKVLKEKKKVSFLKGTYFIQLNQAANRYIIEMLEPTGDDSFLAWNFFDGILQQKEGYSDYRWEDVASELLAKDEVLKKKLEEKKQQDSSFAGNSRAILEFIYRNSPYYEPGHMQYPIYRIDYQ